MFLDNGHGGVANIVRMICEDLNSPMSPLSQGRPSRYLEQALLCSALCSVPNNYSIWLSADDRVELPYYMRAVIRFIKENACAQITLAQMVDVADVSTRSLHASFRKYLHTTPMSYLRNCRLDIAREKLSTAVQDGRSVTDIAFECGFTHLSKFAHDFKQRFGVLPSRLRAGLSEGAPGEVM